MIYPEIGLDTPGEIPNATIFTYTNTYTNNNTLLLCYSVQIDLLRIDKTAEYEGFADTKTDTELI